MSTMTTIMLDQFSSFFFLVIFTALAFFLVFFSRKNAEEESSYSPDKIIPKSYPLIGILPSYLLVNKERLCQWTSDILLATPSGTFRFHGVIGQRQFVGTTDPSNVRHILKTKFHMYIKGVASTSSGVDLLGNGILNSDGDNWKFQRQIASHEFNKKSLRKFVETVVDTELSDRLIPILSAAAAANTTTSTTVVVLDFQDILQRFGFDNICKIAFGYDPEYLTPSLQQSRFAVAFEDSVRLTGQRQRLDSVTPLIWMTKRFLSIGSEKDLKRSVSEVREFAKKVIRSKKRELIKKKKNTTPPPSNIPNNPNNDNDNDNDNDNEDSSDLLSRFLSSASHDDEDFITDTVINYLLAGRDTTSAALTWFFWLVSRNPSVEEKIVKEICGKSELISFDEVNGEMAYTHASLFESMRLYPPVPVDGKMAAEDDVWPDGTEVKRGMSVLFHIYAMGRSEKLWGSDWSEFRPERWLETDIHGKWRFVPKDPYTYPVFQAGPRICLGKDMAILQMKKLVAGVMRRFRVVPTLPMDGPDPLYLVFLTSKMKGGLPVRIEERKCILP